MSAGSDAAHGDGAGRRPAADTRFVIGLTLAAAAAAYFRLGHKGLWYDEVASLSFALSGPREWVSDHNMALYYALLGVWVRAFGHSEWALRSLSALCFTAAAPLLYRLAALGFGTRTARIASLLFVTHATLVHFAQEARGYMLALLLLVAASLRLLQLLERPTPWRAVTYAALCALALYAHMFAALVAFSHGASIAIGSLLRRERPAGAWIGAFALLGLFIAPLLVQAARTGAGQIGWLYPPTWKSLRETLVILAGGNAIAALMLAAAWLAFTLRSLPIAGRKPLARGVVGLVITAWFAVPVVLAFSISAWRTPIVHPKYLLITVPALLIAAADSLARLPRRAGVPALAVLFALAAMRLHFWYAAYQRELFRESITRLAQLYRPGDALVVEAMSRDPFDYYVERLQLTGQLPVPLSPSAPWGVAPLVGRHAQADQVGAVDTAPRVWLLTNRVEGQPLRDRVSSSHALVLREVFEPLDEDGASTFADSSGRVITLELFERGATR